MAFAMARTPASNVSPLSNDLSTNMATSAPA
jgi:hypothetical protein